jgi:hypothetical protein
MAEDLTENRSVRCLTVAEKGQILELNALEYRHARIAQPFCEGPRGASHKLNRPSDSRPPVRLGNRLSDAPEGR